MKIKFLLIGLFFLIVNGLLLAQNEYAVSNIDSELLENAHTVIRYEKKEINIPSVSKSVLKHKKVVTLLSDESRANELEIYYNSFNKVGKIKGKIYNAQGRLIRELNKSEFKDKSAVDGYSIYQESRIIELEVNHSDYPYTVEFEYKKTAKRFMSYSDWYIQWFNVSVENATLIVNAFDENQLGYKAQNIDLEPLIEKDGNKRKYTWTVKHKKAIKYESNSPSYLKIIPTILLMAKSFKLGEYSGHADSWNAYGRFMNKLGEGRDQLPSVMKSKIHELVSNAKSEREKIDILYKYLQQNTRYVSVQLGVGGWQTFSASYVYENEYGDCKALTNYMKSMLKEIGIVSYPVLIERGGNDDWLEEEFVYQDFNHVILNVPSENYWLECTSSIHPPNYLGSDNENRTAFRYTESGGELVTTPDYKADQNQQKNKATITLSTNGDAQLKNEILLTGTRQEYYRQIKFYYTQEDIEKRFLTDQYLPSFTINNYDLQINDVKPEANLSYDVNIKNYASKGGKRLFMPLNLINPNVSVPKSTKKRIHPLHITEDIYDEDQTTFIIPENYKIESMPDSTFTLETDFGFYKVDLKVEGNQLIYTRELKLTSGEYPAERYEDYRNFRKEIGTRDSAKVVLVKKQA